MSQLSTKADKKTQNISEPVVELSQSLEADIRPSEMNGKTPQRLVDNHISRGCEICRMRSLI